MLNFKCHSLEMEILMNFGFWTSSGFFKWSDFLYRKEVNPWNVEKEIKKLIVSLHRRLCESLWNSQYRLCSHTRHCLHCVSSEGEFVFCNRRLPLTVVRNNVVVFYRLWTRAVSSWLTHPLPEAWSPALLTQPCAPYSALHYIQHHSQGVAFAEEPALCLQFEPLKSK